MGTILIIEDNPELRDNTVELLELAGYKVFEAGNGNDGYIKARNNKPDVILCDMVMPQSDGIALLKLIKDEPSTSGIPLIFFSAGSAPLAVQKGMERGADEYLKKPFTNEELLDVVKRCITLAGQRRTSK